MKILRFTYLTVLLVACHFVALGQVDSTGVDSVVIDTTVITPVTLTTPKDTTLREEKKPLFKVVPWKFHAPLGANVTATDSTLRWQDWPDWTYKLNREPGVISYRLGTNNRSNAVQRYAHGPAYQELYWEGVSLNDPVSGALHWSLIPQQKVGYFYDQDLGIEHRSTYYDHQYYLNEPLSRLLYSESKFSFRDLEFEVSHNLSQKTNVELSYWDRRSGGEYQNSIINGRQIYAKISHHLSHRRFLKINYVNNSLDIGQPFGYAIPNMRLFNFDRFTTAPNESSAITGDKSSLFALHFYQRNPDTTKAIDNLHAGLFYRGVERSVEYSTDSTRYKVRSVGLNAKKWWTLGKISVETSGEYQQFFNLSHSDEGFPADNWSQLTAEGMASIDYIPLIDLEGGAAFHLRSDGFQSYRLNASADITIGGLALSSGLSQGTRMPTPQQLYWDSEGYSGDANLKNVKITEAHAELSFNITPDTKLGVRGQNKDITDGIMVVDSTFSNVSSYASQSASAFFEWDLQHFELNGSATVHRFADSYTKPSGTIPMSPRKKVWLKGGAYWKGYLFHRATYVKAGVSGVMSPFRYQPDHYNPALDYWQPVSDDQQLPLFNRLDVDVTARVRSIMFILRWENVLDDVNQLGYFETAQYPMSRRRFIFGVRALFRN